MLANNLNALCFREKEVDKCSIGECSNSKLCENGIISLYLAIKTKRLGQNLDLQHLKKFKEA